MTNFIGKHEQLAMLLCLKLPGEEYAPIYKNGSLISIILLFLLNTVQHRKS